MKFISRSSDQTVSLSFCFVLIANSLICEVKCENFTHEEDDHHLLRMVEEIASGNFMRRNLSETLHYRINRRLDFLVNEDDGEPFTHRLFNTLRTPSTIASSSPHFNRDPLWNSNNRFSNRFDKYSTSNSNYNRRFTTNPTLTDLTSTFKPATTTSRPRYTFNRPSTNSIRPANSAVSSNIRPINVRPTFVRPDKSAVNSKYSAECACRRKMGINSSNFHQTVYGTTIQTTTASSPRTNRFSRTRSLSTISSNEKPYDPRIVNGTTANYYQVPWMVSLGRAIDGKYTNESHYCGATLISPFWVISAGHCLTDFKPKKIFVAYGSGNRNEMKHFVEVDRVVVHPSYSGWPRYLNDIALVKLKEPIRLDASIKPACLLHSNVVQFGRGFEAVGWGRTGVEEEFPSNLQKSKFEHVTLNDCRTRWDKELDHPDITSNNICVYNPYSDICGGDSGSPLINTAEDGVSYVVGVASFTNYCDKTQPAVYVQIYPYIDWIVAVVKNFC